MTTYTINSVQLGMAMAALESGTRGEGLAAIAELRAVLDAPLEAPSDDVINLAQALEQRRALCIVEAVTALPGGTDVDMPTPFQAGYQLACEEITHRLRTEVWTHCLPPVDARSGLPASNGDVLAEPENTSLGDSASELRTAGLQGPIPIDMVLYCPKCGAQHVDAPEPMEPVYGDEPIHDQVARWKHRWTNPPHRSHLCHECGCIWRPADVPTNGVNTIKTKGSNDTPAWPASATPVDQPTSTPKAESTLSASESPPASSSSQDTAGGGEGWIAWGGGVCPPLFDIPPMPPLVDLRLADGSVHESVRADRYDWSHDHSPQILNRIVAYKLAQ